MCRRRRTSSDVDCDPEPIGPSGFQLDLCVGIDLPGGESPYHSGVEVSVADVEGSQTLTLAGGETDFQIPLEATEWVMVGGLLDDSGGTLGALSLGPTAVAGCAPCGAPASAPRELGEAITAVAEGEATVVPRPSARRRRRHGARRRADRHRTRRRRTARP